MMAAATPDVAFDFRLEHGRCVGVRLPVAQGPIDALAAHVLATEEAAYASHLGLPRRRTWVGGRVAMREALARSGLRAPPVLADARGAPELPSGMVGSISHKESLAVALIATVAEGTSARVGVDIEVDETRPYDIGSKVLTDDEAAEIAEFEWPRRQSETRLRFSAKEAIYKALDPFVRRYVSFKEVEVTPRADGTTEVRARVQHSGGALSVEARWLRWEGFVLTTARVELLVR
jgi:enterobactin synthetase component D